MPWIYFDENEVDNPKIATKNIRQHLWIYLDTFNSLYEHDVTKLI